MRLRLDRYKTQQSWFFVSSRKMRTALPAAVDLDKAPKATTFVLLPSSITGLSVGGGVARRCVVFVTTVV